MNRSQRRQLAKDLGLDRGLAKGPAAGDPQPEIAIPEPEGTAHGQLLMPGLASNFIEYPWRGLDSLRDMARRLHDFLKEGDEPYLEFTSPHDGEVHLLTRMGAASIVAINHARAKGPVDPRGLAKSSKIVRVGALPPELLQ